MIRTNCILLMKRLRAKKYVGKNKKEEERNEMKWKWMKCKYVINSDFERIIQRWENDFIM